MRTLDVAAEILREVAPRALSAQEIAEFAISRLRTSSKVPARAISKAISTNVLVHGTDSHFIRVGHGKYMAKESLPLLDNTNAATLNQGLLEKCFWCGEIKARCHFAKTGYKTSYRNMCKRCRNAKACAWQAAHRTSPKLRASRLLASAKTRAKDRALAFDLDRDWVLARLDKGMCEATGIPFDLTADRGWNTPSLDQIRASAGYTKTNTRLVLFALNAACGDWGEATLLRIVSALQSQPIKESSL